MQQYADWLAASDLPKLFVNAEPAVVQATLEQVPLSLLQFHGDEDNADCSRHGMPFIKSVAMREDTDLEAVARSYPDAAGLLLDAWQPRTHGGGGVAFDWRYIRGHIQLPLILAGGGARFADTVLRALANRMWSVRPAWHLTP